MFYDKDEETITRADLEKLQLERLQKIVEYVYKNNAVYRGKMDAAGVKPEDVKKLKDIEKLPFTTKEDLRAAYPFGFFSAPQEKIVRCHASSGTTGKLTVAGYTQKDIDMWTHLMARSIAMAGGTSKSTCHVAFGYGLFTGGLGAHYGAEKIGAAVVPAGTGNTQRQLELMRDFKATHLFATPSYVLYLAETLKKQGAELPNLKTAIMGAEPWTEEMRQQIEKELRIDAYDIYGLSEIMGPGVAMECPHKCGLHIFEDHFLTEILSGKTLKPVKDGELGELVITTLTKEGMPLIRYRTHDITTINRESCACGRNFGRIGKIVGRNDDMLIVGGVNVFPSQIESVLCQFNDIAQVYQIVVSRVNFRDKIEVQVELKNTSLDCSQQKVLQDKIATDVASAITTKADIKILAPGSLPRSEGKSKHVIDTRKTIDNK